MGFYLETVSPDEFSEINQYVSLKGVIASAALFAKEGKEVRKTVDALLEGMADHQKLYLPAMSAGFRSMFKEARQISSISDKIVVLFPAVPEGFMALKACSTLHIPAAISNGGLMQAAFARENKGLAILLDWKILEESGEEKGLQVFEKSEEDCFAPILVNFSNAGQIKKAMALGARDLAFSYKLFISQLYDPKIVSNLEEDRNLWIHAYTRMELFENEEE